MTSKVILILVAGAFLGAKGMAPQKAGDRTNLAYHYYATKQTLENYLQQREQIKAKNDIGCRRAHGLTAQGDSLREAIKSYR